MSDRGMYVNMGSNEAAITARLYSRNVSVVVVA